VGGIGHEVICELRSGWAMRDDMRVELTFSALTMAIRQQRPVPD
jgi:hypothetical protein